MDKGIYIGEDSNWMDFRDTLIDKLQDCYTEQKFNVILTAIFLSVAPSPESINKTRKIIGASELNKKEVNTLKKIFYKNEDSKT